MSFAESTCAAKTIGFSPRDGGPNLLCIEELTKLALERCDTAACAVQLMGDLAVTYGYFNTESGTPAAYSLGGSAECLLVADATQVWHFHVATAPGGWGAVWAAQRVQDTHATALMNAFVIRTMDFEDADTYRASPNVTGVALDAGFWDGESPFDFTAAFAYFNATEMHLGSACPVDYNLYTGRRTWRIFDRLAPGLRLDPSLGHITTRKTYPFSVQPEQAVSVATVKALLRDHYEGTPFDLTRGLAAGPFGNPDRYGGGPNERAVEGAWERGISMHRTTWTFVVESRLPGPAVPAPAATRVWFGFDSPHATVLAPLYATQQVPPPSWTWAKQCTLSRSSAFWASNFVKNWMELRFNVMLPDVQAAQASLEDALGSAADEAEGAVAALLAAVPPSADASEQARLALEQFTVSAAEDVTRRWWALGDALVARYSNGYKCLGDSLFDLQEGDRLSLGYPAAWLRAVGFNSYPATQPPLALAEGEKEEVAEEEEHRPRGHHHHHHEKDHGGWGHGGGKKHHHHRHGGGCSCTVGRVRCAVARFFRGMAKLAAGSSHHDHHHGHHHHAEPERAEAVEKLRWNRAEQW